MHAHVHWRCLIADASLHAPNALISIDMPSAICGLVDATMLRYATRIRKLLLLCHLRVP